MFKFLSKIMVVARATVLEGMQQPVCVMLTLTSIVLTLLQPLVQLHTFGEEGRLTRDSGLAFMLIFGLMIVVLTSGSTVVKEIQRGTVSTALAKPISRTLFLLGKFLGVCAILGVFIWCSSFAVLFAERASERYLETETIVGAIRDTQCGFIALGVPVLSLALAAFINWRWRLRFGLVFFVSLAVLQPALCGLLGFLRRDGTWMGWRNYAFDMDFRVVAAAILVMLLLWIFVSIAIALSTRLQTGAVVSISFAILFVGFLADHLFGGGTGLCSTLLYSIIPDVQHFWAADLLGDGGHIPWHYVARAGVYAVTYMSVILMLGAVSFQHRDLG